MSTRITFDFSDNAMMHDAAHIDLVVRESGLPEAPMAMPMQSLSRSRKSETSLLWQVFAGRKIANG